MLKLKRFIARNKLKYKVEEKYYIVDKVKYIKNKKGVKNKSQK